ncbi:TraI domain-containing protein [Vibrio barjaei]|uniref:TraI domain-containing protein n=1 Tax=Vibrio barjaei TaxID=1676683 RepID=UPI002284EB95|nr:TraI domain-containing protein [Vibrio barjaei]MCY9874535.1 TraI domain-containing protein [Vibrio barjaei]
MLFRRKQRKEAKTDNVVSISKSGNSGEQIFLDPEVILQRPKCQRLLFQIREAVGIQESYFQKMYLQLIHNVAARVQSCHASEYNHHAYDFGLIEHSLEVALYAVRSSLQFNYYPDGDEEKIQKLSPIYTYSTFISAFLHDIGKAFTDNTFMIKNHKGDWEIWSSLYKKVPTQKECVEYKIIRNKQDGKNAYHKNSHELITPAIFLDSMPLEGIQWILEYSQSISNFIFVDLLHSMSGDLDNGSHIGKNVALGDKTSVEDDMQNVESITPKVTKLSDIPIHEAFKIKLIEILADAENFKIAINKRHEGKLSHVERYGDLIFCASKFIVDIVSKALRENDVNVPSDKKFFQLLLDNKISLATPSGDSLWWCDFYLNEEANPKDLTYIAIKVDTLHNPNIEDLSLSKVKLRFAPKTTNGVDHGPILPKTDYDHQLQNLIYGNRPESELKKDEISKSGDPTVIDVTPDEVKSIDDILPPIEKTPEFGGLKPTFDDPVKKGSSNRKKNNKVKKASTITTREVKDDSDQQAGNVKDEIHNSPKTQEPKNTHGATPGPVEQDQPTKPDEQDVSITTPSLRNPKEPAWISKDNGRQSTKDSADQVLHDTLFPLIQQIIDRGKGSFNSKDSSIHYTDLGIFLVAPLFFEHFDKSLARKYREAIKRSSYCMMANGNSIVKMVAKTNDDFKKANKGNVISGFLLCYHDFKYNNKSLPANKYLELADFDSNS